MKVWEKIFSLRGQQQADYANSLGLGTFDRTYNEIIVFGWGEYKVHYYTYRGTCSFVPALEVGNIREAIETLYKDTLTAEAKQTVRERILEMIAEVRRTDSYQKYTDFCSYCHKMNLGTPILCLGDNVLRFSRISEQEIVWLDDRGTPYDSILNKEA